jgi:DTW domain-containing protein
MHCREVKKTTATAPVALSALVNSERHEHGEKGKALDLSHLHDQGRRVLVLFPSDSARPLSAELLSEDSRPVTLVVPDGNWRQATRIPDRVPGLIEAERVTLAPGAPTRWGIRRETRESGLSTFEAIARALGVLESKEVQEQLETVFDLMVNVTIAQRGNSNEMGRDKLLGL